MTKKRGVPDGWLPVSAIGKPITGTKFLAFKVPLKDTLCNNLEPDERFSPSMLLEKEPNLRLVIDLTNTKRYYDKNDFTQNGVNYEKIFCPGREIPSKDLMIRFFNVVDNFMQSEDTEDKFIGVHCTHGINRTGYFICTYMIQKLGFTPEKAISAFQEARGHEIVRDYFIQELMKDPEKFQDKLEPKLEPSSFPHSSHRHRQAHTQRPFNRRFQRGPPGPQGSRGPHRGPRHRGPHFSARPPPEQNNSHIDPFYRQSQLNYYEDEVGYGNLSWRRRDNNTRGRHSSYNKKS